MINLSLINFISLKVAASVALGDTSAVNLEIQIHQMGMQATTISIFQKVCIKG